MSTPERGIFQIAFIKKGEGGIGMSAASDSGKKVTAAVFKEMKDRGEKITMLTAYDYPTACLLDEAGVDAILVGDSLGMVVLGYESTLAVTMEDMLHHTRAVARGAKRAMVVGDMPFMSYQAGMDEAMRNAGRFLKEAGAAAVKLEGGSEIAPLVRRMTMAGIPVMGHLGLTPQSINQIGGYTVQGKTKEAARRILDDALALEEAGAFSLVLEKVPRQLASLISKRLSIPVIGIGAGVECDGQVLVTNDMIGLFERFRPKFVKRYAEIGSEMRRAFEKYVREVKGLSFPGDEHSYTMDEGELPL